MGNRPLFCYRLAIMVTGVSGVKPHPEKEPFVETGRAALSAMRTGSQKVVTAVMRLFTIDPAQYHRAYQAEQYSKIVRFIDQINQFTSVDLDQEDLEAASQHVMARLAKKVSYLDFSVLTDEQRAALIFKIPLYNKLKSQYEVVSYHLTERHLVADFCDTSILTAKGHPPILLVPGTFPKWDSPGKLWESVGANLQGSTWKTVADDLKRTVLPHLTRLSHQAKKENPNFSESFPTAIMIGHSAGSAALRLFLIHHKRVPSKQKKTLLEASFHAFSPPATSETRAENIKKLESRENSGGFTTYIDLQDPIPHMSGSTHAGNVLTAPPDERSFLASHSIPPLPIKIGRHLIRPYMKEHTEHWALNRIIAIGTVTFIALINISGVPSLLSTVKPIIKEAFYLVTRLLGALALIGYALITLNAKKLAKTVKKEALTSAAASEKLFIAVFLAPLRFLYKYWNNGPAPTIYATTGLSLYLRSRYLDLLLS